MIKFFLQPFELLKKLQKNFARYFLKCGFRQFCSLIAPSFASSQMRCFLFLAPGKLPHSLLFVASTRQVEVFWSSHSALICCRYE